MGPRLISRGISIAWGQLPTPPGFNGAAADQPRNSEFHGGDNSMHCASMGPRLISRGIRDQRGTEHPASLGFNGPRLISRGIQVLNPDEIPGLRLQWGRG